MEKTEFVTKDNVHEATNLEKIRSLMANAERLGDDEVVKRCNARLLELSNTIIRFPEIDYNLWKIASKQFFPINEQREVSFWFEVLERR